MKKLTLHTFIIVALTMAATFAFADRGGFGRKDKKRVILDIVNAGSLKNSMMMSMRSGYTFKGSYTLSSQRTNSAIINNSIMSYKRGNTMYIVPYKQKILIPEFNRSTGYKLIIRSNR